MTAPIRALVVDDSAFVRKVVREILERGGVEVIGVARDGLDALEKIDRLAPDVVTLDLMMPHLDGRGVLEALAERDDPPPVIVLSRSGADTALGLDALELGAIAVVEKPTALATSQLFEMGKPLLANVLAAARTRPAPAPLPPSLPPAVVAPLATRRRLLVIGTSTGGPRALSHLVPSLPAAMPIPVVIALHIPAGYTAGIAARLDARSPLEVREAEDGAPLLPGTVTLARGGSHIAVVARGDALVTRVEVAPLTALYRPSIDRLFQTSADACGDGLIAAVLTGMGDDGTKGAEAVRAAGGDVITEAESSCVVYGMPRAVVAAGLSQAEVPLEGLVAALLARL